MDKTNPAPNNPKGIPQVLEKTELSASPKIAYPDVCTRLAQVSQQESTGEEKADEENKRLTQVYGVDDPDQKAGWEKLMKDFPTNNAKDWNVIQL